MATASTPSRTILLVEDNHANRTVLTIMLKYYGFEVEVACCGKEAIEKIHTAPKPFAAILMDVYMPDMDGYQVTQTIRKLEKEKGVRNIIIGLTGYALASDRECCLQSGMNDHISKPVNLDLLIQKLESIENNYRFPSFADIAS